MRIRHIIASDNLDAEGFVLDPLLARHAVIVGGAVADLAGPIDPLTHLNLDFADHRMDVCLVAERLERGAAVLRAGDQFLLAQVRRAALARLGPVDIAARRAAWQQATRQAGRP